MKTQTSKTAAVMGLLSRGPVSAPARAAGSDPDPAERTIEEITADILRAQVDGGKAVLTIGNGLIEAKGKLNHGEWLDWLTENVGYSEKSAENYMRIARNYSNPQLVADLGMRKALSLLALPETDRATFVSEANVVDMTSRELEKAIRERAEALAEKAAAEEARDKMSGDMEVLRQTLEGVQQDRDAALRDAEKRESKRLELEQTADRLTQELEALKARPVEVAVQVDQDAVEKAREEGYQQAKKELKTAEKAAGEQVSKANADAARVKTELDQARKEIENLKFEASRAEKPSPLASDAELAQFKLLFDQAQTIVNQMHGLLMKVRGRQDGETAAGKLVAALKALSESVGRYAE